MGFPVFSVPSSYGLTSGFNRAWKYFTSFPKLQAMFLLNNDVTVPKDAFSRLHRCMMNMETPGAVVTIPRCRRSAGVGLTRTPLLRVLQVSSAR